MSGILAGAACALYWKSWAATSAINSGGFGLSVPLQDDHIMVPGQLSAPANTQLSEGAAHVVLNRAPPPSPPSPPSPASKAPKQRPINDELTALLEKVALDNIVVATSTDFGYLGMTMNWICHLRALGLEKNVIVFSLDERIHEAVKKEGLTSYFETEMGKETVEIGNWNSRSYNQVVHSKTKHQRAVLMRGFDLFFCDVDIPWTSDYRVQLMKDVPDHVAFVGQQNWPQCDMNVGFFYARR